MRIAVQWNQALFAKSESVARDRNQFNEPGIRGRFATGLRYDSLIGIAGILIE